MNFGLNSNPTGAPPAASGSLTFGTPSTMTFGAAAAAPLQANVGAAAAPQLSFGAPQAAATSQPSLSFGGSAPFTLGGSTNTTAAPKPLTFGLGAPAATAPTSSVAPQLSMAAPNPLASMASLGGGGMAASGGGAQPTATLGGVAAAKPLTQQASLSTSTTTTASANAPAAQLSFSNLEEHINKWTLALDEQEKMFMNQATQVNSWDKVLISNNNKIVALSEAVEKVRHKRDKLRSTN